MFDYDSYYCRLEQKQVDPDLDFPVSIDFIDQLVSVEYTSGCILVFDAEFFYENAHFIATRKLLSTVKLKGLFEY